MTTTSKPFPRRLLACAFATCALATVALLSHHPGGGGNTITEVLQAEARNQVTDAVVHGGFILISAILIVCLAGLSRILETSRVAVATGFVAFCVGAGALMMSMGLDGLVVPAIAARSLGENTPAALASAQTLLLFCGTCIKFLMPVGLLFECAAMLSFSIAMLARRWVWVGGFGIAAGISLLSAPLLLSGFGVGLIMGGILALCLWYLAVAVRLWLERPGSETP